MDTKIFFTKRKILSLTFIAILLCFCLFFALRLHTIHNAPTPLSGVNLEAMFYIQNEESGSMTCVGDGLINSSQEVICNETTVANAIVTAPDYSSYLSTDLTVVWETIRNTSNGLQVVGEVSSKANRKSKRSVTEYGAVGDGVTDDSDAILRCIAENQITVFPSGTYYVTKQIVIPNGHTLLGYDNAVIDFHNNATTGYNYGYIVNENASWLNRNDLAHDIEINNLTIKKSNVSATEKAIILLSNVTNVTINKVNVITSYNDCINTIDILVNVHNVKVSNSNFYNNQGSHAGGMWVRDRYNNGISNGTDNITFYNCYFEKNSGIDEVLAIFTVPSDSNYGKVADVTIDSCKFLYNYNGGTAANKENAPYFITVTLGDTENIKFTGCSIIDNNLTVGAIKFNPRAPFHSFAPVEMTGCTIECNNGYWTYNSTIFYVEGKQHQQEHVRVTNCKITASGKVSVTSKHVNISNSDLYISNNAVAMTSNSTATNCNFYVENCTRASRVFNNGNCSVIDSYISFDDTSNEYILQPKELVNTKIDSTSKVIVK